MAHYKVLYDSWTDVTREAVEDEWDRDDTATSHSIEGFEVVGKDDYFDDSVSFEPAYKHPYYLLYVLYGTGDSFSHDEGQIMFVGLFEKEENAKRNEKSIHDHGEEISMSLLAEDGDNLVKYQIDAPWVGYFECLEDVRVEVVYRK